jgi:hypothetical protein
LATPVLRFLAEALDFSLGFLGFAECGFDASLRPVRSPYPFGLGLSVLRPVNCSVIVVLATIRTSVIGGFLIVGIVEVFICTTDIGFEVFIVVLVSGALIVFGRMNGGGTQKRTDQHGSFLWHRLASGQLGR